MQESVKTFSNNLKLLRKGRGLSQTKLAEKVGLTKQSIINYEKGITFPTGNRLQKLLDALEVSAEQLLGNDFLVPDSQKELLDTLNDLADFRMNYNENICPKLEQEEIGNYLLNQLSSFSNSDLFYAINSILQKRIDTATSHYLKERTEALYATIDGHTLNMDIYLAQDDD